MRAPVACLWFQCPDFPGEKHFLSTRFTLTVHVFAASAGKAYLSLEAWMSWFHPLVLDHKIRGTLVKLQNTQISNPKTLCCFSSIYFSVGYISCIRSKRDNPQTNSFICKINTFLVPPTPASISEVGFCCLTEAFHYHQNTLKSRFNLTWLAV